MVDISEEEAKSLASLNTKEKIKEIKRLNALMTQYKLLLYLMAITVGWAAYSTNMSTFYTKNVLDLSAEASTQVNSIAFLPWSMKPIWGFLVDSVFLFRYRFKSHCAIVSLINCLVMAALIYQPKPTRMPFTLILFLQTAAISYLDSMAQGMTAMITKLGEKAQALEEPDGISRSPLKIFARYTLVKLIVRCLMAFVRGYVAERTARQHLLVSGFIMASFPLLLFFLTLFVFKEERKMKTFRGCANFVMGLKKTGKSVFVKKAMGPYFILVLYQFIPQMPQIYTFMLLSTGGWSFDLFNFTTLIGSLAINMILLFGFPRIGKAVNCHVLILAGAIMAGLSLLLSSGVILSNEYTPDSFSIYWTLASSMVTLSGTLILVTVVGRVSRLLPEGFESIGIALITSFVNICTSAGQFLGSELATVYGVKAGYYGRMLDPQVIVVSSAIALIGISP